MTDGHTTDELSRIQPNAVSTHNNKPANIITCLLVHPKHLHISLYMIPSRTTDRSKHLPRVRLELTTFRL